MGNSPYYDKFLRQEDHIDTDMITTPLDNKGSGWLLSIPSTRIFSRMKLSSSPKPPYSHHRKRAAHANTMAFASSMELQRQTSISELSNPGLTEDQGTSWAGSEISLLETELSNTISSPQLPYYEDWNSWFPESPKNFSKKALPLRDSNLSTWNRNFASTNLSDLEVAKSPTLLSKPDVPKSPYRKPKVQPSFSALPPTSPSKNRTYTARKYEPYRAHKSWPVETQTERPQLRARSNTHPENLKANRPSNLSICTTLDNDSCLRSPSSLSNSTTSGHLYMRSPPLTPDIYSSSNSTSTSRCSSDDDHSALNAYLSTQSFFFHDDDDNTKEASWLDSQCRKFQLLTGASCCNPSTIPSIREPPSLRAADHYYNTKFTKERRAKNIYGGEKKMMKKKSTLGLRAGGGLREMFGIGVKKSFYDLFEEGRDSKVKERVNVDEKVERWGLRKREKKQCPKCKWMLEKKGESKMVTCWCRADLCFGCMGDWDFCEGRCY